MIAIRRASDPDPGEENAQKQRSSRSIPKRRRGCAGGDIHRLYLRRRCFIHRLTGCADWFLYGQQGLPVATGETKIGISAWPNDQLEESTDSYLSADTLSSDDLTMMAPLLEGTDYAVAPILAQVNTLQTAVVWMWCFPTR